jgi:hypothetical protein
MFAAPFSGSICRLPEVLSFKGFIAESNEGSLTYCLHDWLCWSTAHEMGQWILPLLPLL